MATPEGKGPTPAIRAGISTLTTKDVETQRAAAILPIAVATMSIIAVELIDATRAAALSIKRQFTTGPFQDSLKDIP
jgi:hypothetical protein